MPIFVFEPIIHLESERIHFETLYFSFDLQIELGLSSGLFVHGRAENLIAAPKPFVSYNTTGNPRDDRAPETVSYLRVNDRQGFLDFHFNGGIQMRVACMSFIDHVYFDLIRITDPQAKEARIASLFLKDGITNPTTGSVTYIERLFFPPYSNRYHISEQSLNPQTNIELVIDDDTHFPCLSARSVDPGAEISTLGLLDSKVALIACEEGEWLQISESVETVHDLPRFHIDGLWAKTYPDLETSYLFVDLTRCNVARIIEYARRGGFSYILVRQGAWAKTLGHYHLNENNYRDLDEMRAIRNLVHLAGMKFGLHFLSATISDDDEYKDEPAVAPHSGIRLPDVRSSAGLDLLRAMAGHFAEIYRYVQADMVYLDGVLRLEEVFSPENYGWFTASLLAEMYYRALAPGSNALVQTAISEENYLWHAPARFASYDFPVIGVEAYTRNFKLNEARQQLRNSPMKQELGWNGLLAKVGGEGMRAFSSTGLDEIEYQLNLSLGENLPLGLESTEAQLDANALSGAILDRIAFYEQARRSGSVPHSLRSRLREPESLLRSVTAPAQAHYFLAQDERGQYNLTPRVILEHEAPGPDDEWVFDNPFDPQNLNLKIVALPSLVDLANYRNPPNLPLLAVPGPAHATNYPKTGIGFSYPDPTDGNLVKFTNRTPGVQSGWVKLEQTFAPARNLGEHKAIALRADVLDTGGARLAISVMLTAGTSSPAFRQYQVKVDSPGPLSKDFLLPSTVELFEFPEGIPPEVKKNSFRPFNYYEITSVTLWVKFIDLPGHGEVQIRFEPVFALQQGYSRRKESFCPSKQPDQRSALSQNIESSRCNPG